MTDTRTGHLTVEEAVKALDAIAATDPEGAHGLADAILEATVDRRVREAYQRLIDRCRWWGTA